MALVNEQAVNAQFLKVNHAIFSFGIVKPVELRLDRLSGFH